tara:strand:+ start:301 stop:405 length:105 start_codon:yes stop_codon:yes gene_type:complete
MTLKRVGQAIEQGIALSAVMGLVFAEKTESAAVP